MILYLPILLLNKYDFVFIFLSFFYFIFRNHIMILLIHHLEQLHYIYGSFQIFYFFLLFLNLTIKLTDCQVIQGTLKLILKTNYSFTVLITKILLYT